MLSQGAILEIETTSGVWFRIPKPTEIPLPSRQKDEHEITNLDSSDKEFEAGLGDGGDLTVPFFVTEDGGTVDEYCEDWCDAADTRNVRITGPSGRTRTFAGFGKNYVGPYQTNTPLQRSLTIRVSGSTTRSWAGS